MPKAAPTAAERLVRNSARAALYLALVGTGLALELLLTLAHPPVPAEMRRIDELQSQWSGVDFSVLPEVQLLRAYIGIDTSEPNANEVPGAEFLAAQLAAAGLTPHIERLAGNRANLWAFVEGDDPRAIVLAGHIDVEPARELGNLELPAVRRGDPRSLDLRPRDLRHEEPDDRAAPGDDRCRPGRRQEWPQAEAIDPLPRDFRRGTGERNRNALDSPRPPRARRPHGCGAHRRRRRRSDRGRRDQVLGHRVRAEALHRDHLLQRRRREARRPARRPPGRELDRPDDAGLAGGRDLSRALCADARARVVPGLAGEPGGDAARPVGLRTL